MKIVPAPVRKSISVQAAPERAFTVFTAGMGRWWLRSHSINASPIADVVIEPHVGGRWYERGEDGSECEWGRVLAWNPPHGLTLAWQLDAAFKFDPALVTEVEVKFVPLAANRTRVELEHRLLERFGEEAENVSGRVGSDNGWTAILKSFAATADAS